MNPDTPETDDAPSDKGAVRGRPAATCSPRRWIRCKAFVEVMGKRAAVEFRVQADLPCKGACEMLAKKNDEAIASYVAGASMKSGIEVVESYWENAQADPRPEPENSTE